MTNGTEIKRILAIPREDYETIRQDFAIPAVEPSYPRRLTAYGIEQNGLIKNTTFVAGKKGRNYYWAYINSQEEDSATFMILGHPHNWIRIQLRGEQIGPGYRNYNDHNALIELKFSLELLKSEREIKFENYSFSYNAFTSFPDISGGGKGEMNFKHSSEISLVGQSVNGERVFEHCTALNNINSPLDYVLNSPGAKRSFFLGLLDDLNKASPTASNYAKQVFGRSLRYQ